MIMKRYFRATGYFCLIVGLISMILLLVKGLKYYEIDNRYIFASLVFIATLFPAIGIKLLKNNKL